MKLPEFFLVKIFKPIILIVLLGFSSACQLSNAQNIENETNASDATISTGDNSNISSITNNLNNALQSEPSQISEVTQNYKSELYGNTNSNIANGAFIAFDGSYTFYSLPLKTNYVNFQGELVKIDSSETNKNVIQSGDIQGYLNCLDGWIYYISNGLIYKVNNDGSKVALVTTTNFDGKIIQGITSQNLYAITSMTIFDLYIYCSIEVPLEQSNNINGIYKINTSNGEVEQISKSRNACLTIYDNWIYYNNADDNWSIYKMKIDGTENTKLCTDEGSELVIEDNILYYIKANDSKLYTINLQSGETRQFSIASQIFNINLTNGWVYYTTSEGLYRVKNNGADNTRICDFVYTIQNKLFGGINIVNDWIYFIQYQNNVLSLNRVKIDGSNLQIVQ